VNRGNLVWGTILIIIGAMFLLDNLNIMDFGDFISTFWPLILIIIGIKIIVDRQQKKSVDYKSNVNSGSYNTDSNMDHLNESSTFGDLIRNIKSDDFTGGTVNNIFGDIRIDLSAVKIKNKECHIALNSIFGDITVILPKEILLKAKASAIAGDLQIKGTRRDGLMPNLEFADPGYENSTVKIYVQAGIIFGSVNIF
jgi:predicted membrane protein